MIRAALAVCLLLCAGLVPAHLRSADRFVAPPSDAAATLVALGRQDAAGAALWILTTQQVGRDAYEAAGMPHLERWLEAVFRLNPHLTDAYTLGTVLLLTDRERAPRMDELLEQAETRYPESYEFPMLRGISAYFGRLDAESAATHFLRAATLEGAPPYLAPFGARLQKETATCGNLIVNMKGLAASGGAQVGSLRKQAPAVLERCLARELEQAAAAFRLNNHHDANIDELIAEGYLAARPPAPPGRCWKLINATALLLPCEDTKTP